MVRFVFRMFLFRLNHPVRSTKNDRNACEDTVGLLATAPGTRVWIPDLMFRHKAVVSIQKNQHNKLDIEFHGSYEQRGA